MFSANAYSAASMGYYGGFVMEMDSKEKNTQERTTMLVKEVNREIRIHQHQDTSS